MIELSSKPQRASRIALALVATVLTWGAGGSALAQDAYRLTIFGPADLGGFAPLDINSSGQMVGHVPSLADTHNGWGVALPDGAGLSAVGTGFPEAINNAGQVAGSTIDSLGVHQATLWDSIGTATLLGPGSATDVNDLGVVVGWRYVSGNLHAMLWQGDSETDLGPGYATAINNAGQIVGAATDLTGFSHAALWDSNGVTILGARNSFATDINDRGQIVGSNYFSGSNHNHAHLWDGTRSVDLSPVGSIFSIALDINNSEQVVGTWYGGPPLNTRPGLLLGNVGLDLNTLLRRETAAAGWAVATVNALNESGSIVGQAYNRFSCPFLGHVDCATYGYVLSISDLPDQLPDITTAIPEPSTYALMLAGLAALGWWFQRRRAANASE